MNNYMTEKEQVLSSFDKNYQKAIQDGWTVRDGLFLPPETHIAIVNAYAAVYYRTKENIGIPSYFLRYYQ